MASPAPIRPSTADFISFSGRESAGRVAPGEAPRAQRTPFIAAVLTIFGVTLALLLPALFNRYPILFPDTADYLLRSRSLVASPIRAPGYALWIRLTSAGATLWLPIVAQSLFLATLIVRTLRQFGPPTARQMSAIALALTIGTPVGWVSSRAMPDLFIAMVILGLHLLVAHWERLGRGDRVLVVASVLAGGTMHLTNLLVGGAALVALFALQRTTRAAPDARRAWMGAAALLVTSAVLTRGMGHLRRDGGETGGNRGVFVLAHLVETGLAQRLLQDRCGIERYALCPVRDTLTRSVDLFMWRPLESPRYFVLRDDPALIGEEAGRILGGIVRHYPLALAGSFVSYTARQLVAFRANDEIWRHRHRTEVQRVIMSVYPGDLPAQERARQQENTLRLPWTPLLHLFIFLAAAAFSLIMLRRAFAERAVTLADSTGLHVVVWVTLVVNAAICANLAAVFSRYQSRVSWLLPLAVIATLLERGMLRWPLPALRLTTRP